MSNYEDELVRKCDPKLGVLSEFGNRDAAMAEWKRVLEKHGYRYDKGCHAWRKQGHRAVIAP